MKIQKMKKALRTSLLPRRLPLQRSLLILMMKMRMRRKKMLKSKKRTMAPLVKRRRLSSSLETLPLQPLKAQ
jgi:hypothetical protein